MEVWTRRRQLEIPKSRRSVGSGAEPTSRGRPSWGLNALTPFRRGCTSHNTELVPARTRNLSRVYNARIATGAVCRCRSMLIDSFFSSLANLSTSTRISSLTLYTVSQSINNNEEKKNLTYCGI
jgi:hypothetical protein